MRYPMLGIDVAQATLACALLQADGSLQRKSVPNSAAGCRQLLTWVTLHQVDPPALSVCLEATGGFELVAAQALLSAGAVVYRINPARVRYWSLSEQIRTKTDRVDARCLAEFGIRAGKLQAWHPRPVVCERLTGLVRQRDAIQASITEYANRRNAPSQLAAIPASCDTVLTALREERRLLTQQITTLLRTELRDEANLVTSMIGIGEMTAALLLGEFGTCDEYTSGRQLGAMAGLSVRHHDSGTSVHAKPRITKQGSAAIWKALYWPAITAIKHDPQLRVFAERLARNGKAPLQIICAVMRKLLERVFAILRSRTPYDPTYRSPLALRRNGPPQEAGILAREIKR